MLKEILGVVEKTNTQPILITFAALAISTFPKDDGTVLVNPFTWQIVLLPFLVFTASVFVSAWLNGIHKLNSYLAENDDANFGPLFGCSILAFCILVTFSYLSSHPNGLSLTLLNEPNFIWICALYLLAAETIKIRRS